MALISDLPIDVLAFILGRLCLRDYIRCRAVCSEWNFVVSLNPNPRQVPWLLLTRTEADEANEICRFYDFYHGVELTVAIPGVRWRRCIGSSDGWLMILDDFSELSMFNPLTGVRIALPSITTLPDVEPVFDSSGRVSHYRIMEGHMNPDYPRSPDLLTTNETCESYYYKAIVRWTSHSSYIAVVIWGYDRLFAFARPGDQAWTLVKMGQSYLSDDVIFYEGRFAFARPGDEAWTFVNLGQSYLFEDVIFYEGRFYTAGISGTVESHDLNGPIPILSTVAMDLKRYTWQRKYLVEMSSNLFEVLRMHDDFSPEDDGYDLRTTSFEVYMIDRDTKKWITVKSLDDYALFLGDNYSIAVSKRDFPALKENSIYFTDDYWEGIMAYKNITRDLGVFSLKDGSIEPFYPNGPQQTWPQPSWFVPNLSHNV